MSKDANIHLDALVDAASRGMHETSILSMTEYLRTFDPKQLKEDSVSKLRQLLDLVSIFAPDPLAIDTFYKAVQRYPSNTLTPVHHFLVRQCCSSRSYQNALPLLALSIERIPSNGGLIYTDHLLYHFYGGLCYAALKMYSRALSALSLAISVGGNSTSLIQLEAYKKYILISLIEHSKLIELPNKPRESSRRSLETLGSTYRTFSEIYSDTTVDIDAFVATHRQEFTADGNLELVNSAISSIASHQILKVKNIYTSLSLDALAGKLKETPEQTKNILSSMVADDRIVAHIDDDGFVQFPLVVHSVGEQVAKLEHVYTSVGSLNTRMTNLRKTLELDPEYVANWLKLNASDSRRKGKEKLHRRTLSGPLQDVGMMDADSDSCA